MARPLPKASLSGSDAKVLSGYLRNSASIAAVRLEWAVNMMPKLDMLSPEVLYCIGHMPVQRIQICALVVGASVYEKRCVYTLDDGSGVTLDCICWRDRAPADHSGWEEDSLFQVGQTLSITGKLEEYRNQRQLNVQTMQPERDARAECRHMLKCETLWRNKYSQPTFSISQEMANITQSQFKLPSSSQMSLASSGMLSSDATLSCTDFSSDALEPSYASSQPPSFNASSFLNTSLFSSSRLPKPSSIPDAKLSPTLFRHYVAAYFQRHATAACSAHSLMKMNEALKRLGRRTVKHCGMSTGQAGRISAFGRISKSGSQESVGASQEDSTLRLFSQTLNALARDGVIVPATEADRGALQPSKASASPSASGWKKHAFYVCLTADLLRRVLSRCLGQLHARAMKGRESGVSESTLVDEVRESEDGRWYWVSDKEMKRVLDELDQDEEQPVMKVVSRNGQVRWLWCA